MAIAAGRHAVANVLGALCRSWTVCTLALVVGEAALLCVIIKHVAYTEIDYATYVAQKDLVLAGERDYAQIRGPAGPLVYPAGHVWLYAMIDAVCGSVGRAQGLFVVLYTLDVYVVARLYRTTFSREIFPPVLLGLLALNKRAHSAFALRLFNDGPCALLSHAAVLLFTQQRDSLACIVYSLACSIKMSALLYAPAVYVVLAAKRGHVGALKMILACCASVQVAVGLPFLVHSPVAYITAAFDFGRGFKHRWSVNFKWVPCTMRPLEFITPLQDCDGPFASASFKAGTLLLHLGLLALVLDRFLRRRNFRGRGGLGAFLRAPLKYGPLPVERVAPLLFACNFVGVACARSLHFQFVVWYGNTLPLLLWTTALPRLACVVLVLGVEACWNPRSGAESSSVASSLALTACHAAVVAALLVAPREGKRKVR